MDNPAERHQRQSQPTPSHFPDHLVGSQRFCLNAIFCQILSKQRIITCKDFFIGTISRFMSRVLAICVVVVWLAASLSGTGHFRRDSGFGLRDPSGAGVTNAKITVRNLETNATHEAMSEPDGSFRFPQLPIGPHESTVVKRRASLHCVRGPIVLRLNQIARLDIKLELATITERVTVVSDAPAEREQRRDGCELRTAEDLRAPLAPNRNVLNLALSVAGVNQLQTDKIRS